MVLFIREKTRELYKGGMKPFFQCRESWRSLAGEVLDVIIQLAAIWNRRGIMRDATRWWKATRMDWGWRTGNPVWKGINWVPKLPIIQIVSIRAPLEKLYSWGRQENPVHHWNAMSAISTYLKHFASTSRQPPNRHTDCRPGSSSSTEDTAGGTNYPVKSNEILIYNEQYLKCYKPPSHIQSA